MSTTVIPHGANGTWTMTPLTAKGAAKLADRHNWISAVGHDSTAEIMGELLQQPVETNRVTVEPKEGDHFLCFKLKRRPPEGAILTRTQLEELGYEWCLLSFEEAGPGQPLDDIHLGDWEDFTSHIQWSKPPAQATA